MNLVRRLIALDAFMIELGHRFADFVLGTTRRELEL